MELVLELGLDSELPVDVRLASDFELRHVVVEGKFWKSIAALYYACLEFRGPCCGVAERTSYSREAAWMIPFY